MNTKLLIIATCAALHAFSGPIQAEDKMGIRFMITKKTLDRADGKPGYMREIDRTMALKAQIKNITNKDLPAGKIDCIILIRRWTNETGSLDRYTQEFKIEPLRAAQEVDQLLGEYHIGGHMHGTADYHVDQLAAWKVTFDHDGKKVEFVSNANFESLNKHATTARR